MGLAGKRNSAFTLVELLVVIAIIAVLIAVLLPALGAARTAARKAATSQQVKSIEQGIERFVNDKQRLPGAFTQTELARNTSGTPQSRLTAMENALLELAYPQDQLRNAAFTGSAAVTVDGRTVHVRDASSAQDNLFAPQGSYLDFDAGNLRVIAGVGSDAVPELLDPFDTPVLLWLASNRVDGDVQNFSQMAQIEYDGSNPAYFYWNTNAGVLSQTNLNGEDQASLSLFGLGTPQGETTARSDAQVLASMRALLGSAAYPSSGSLAATNGTPGDLYPLRPRGRVIVQSAGPDAVFFNSESRAARGLFGANHRFVGEYDRAFYSGSEDLLPEADRVDLGGRFDDLLSR